MIFYFSGTGNTRWVAETISQQTGERLIAIADELYSGTDMNKSVPGYTLKENERIGFCFPVHGWQPPAIVRKFIRKLVIDNAADHYTFAVCTCGDTVGDTITILNKDLKKRGLTLSSAFSLVMPESYVCLPFMYTDTKEREQEKISIAKEQLVQITQAIETREKDTFKLKTGPTPRLYSYVIGGYFNRFMITDRPFTVDEDKCIKCGKCATVCPVHDITGGKESAPAWKGNGDCTCCLACYHHCPTHAINYGKRTRTRGQYYFKSEKQ